MVRTGFLLALAALLSCGDGAESDVDRAQRGCRARYDVFQRWVTGRGRLPETDAEWNQIRGEARDPWGRPYEFEVEGASLRVWSDGPDRTPETGDDLCYPPLPDGR